MYRRIKLGAVIVISSLLLAGFAWPSISSSAAALTSTLTAVAGPIFQAKVPEKLTLNEGKKPGVVNFNHKEHGARAEKLGKGCVECHHTSTNAKLKTEKPPKCESCHLAKGNAKNPKVGAKEIWIQEAFHSNCQSCHKQQKKGPVKCLECHAKSA
jgi:hypothetical protein